MEYCNGGDLENFFEKYMNENQKPFSEEIVQHIMRQLLEANNYLNNKKIIYRNFKLENILIHYEDEDDLKENNILKAKIKITDFSFSRYLKKGDLANTIIGTPFNMSPILINKLNKVPNYKFTNYDKKEDIWSLGTICYRLLTGEETFDSEDIDELYQKINKGDYLVPITLSKETISFLSRPPLPEAD